MKWNRVFTYIILFLSILSLSACSSKKQKLIGKYTDIYDETHYLCFNDDGSFIDSFLITTSKEDTSISDHYIYQIDNNGLITITSTLEYESQDSLDKYDFGWLYNDYIGIWLDGTLPTNNTEAFISCSLNGFGFEFHFNNDNTYEYITISNSEIDHTESGTYSVNENKVVCTGEDGATTTFINAEDKVFCIKYVNN